MISSPANRTSIWVCQVPNGIEIGLRFRVVVDQVDLHMCTGLTVAELTRKVEDRAQWKIIVHDAADPRIEDG